MWATRLQRLLILERKKFNHVIITQLPIYLHASLRKILGNHVTQKGSLVNDEEIKI